ncbi:glutathione S-transferase T3-like [Salvia miltiorrhiza]|uniref:glutathione S-transferase T3-like n=1 Tax=Salvia miltiorrhiza TaxID=226208 RepID=UPI0025ABC160|nr:glutathione S-transferase T3-like [Salvia miltiorrhiza]
MDRGNNSFFNSQNFNPSQDYYPNLADIPSSNEFPEFDYAMNSEFSQNPTDSPISEYHQTSENFSANPSNNAQSWTDIEDISLMSAWCFVSNNPIVGTNRNSKSFWKTVADMYEQSRADNPEIGGRRSVESLRNRYKRLNKNVTLWVAAYKKAYERRASGQSKEDIEKAAQAIYGKPKFTHHEVFEKVMSSYPNWELKLDSTGYVRRSHPDDEDSVDESRSSSKKSRTDENADPPTDSTPETPGSDASKFQRPIGRDKAKGKAKRKGKQTESQSSIVSDAFTAELREMRITREKEMKTSTLNTLMKKTQLSPEEETLKRRLMAELYGM